MSYMEIRDSGAARRIRAEQDDLRKRAKRKGSGMNTDYFLELVRLRGLDDVCFAPSFGIRSPDARTDLREAVEKYLADLRKLPSADVGY